MQVDPGSCHPQLRHAKDKLDQNRDCGTPCDRSGALDALPQLAAEPEGSTDAEQGEWARDWPANGQVVEAEGPLICCLGIGKSNGN